MNLPLPEGLGAKLTSRKLLVVLTVLYGIADKKIPPELVQPVILITGIYVCVEGMIDVSKQLFNSKPANGDKPNDVPGSEKKSD